MQQIRITERKELSEYEIFKHQIVCQKISTCQNVRLEYYTNYMYDYIYRYKNGCLEEVIKKKTCTNN